MKIKFIAVFVVLASLGIYLLTTLSDDKEIIDYSVLYEDYSEYNQSYENDDLRIELFSASDEESQYLIYNIELFEDNDYTVHVNCKTSINDGYRLEAFKVTEKGSHPFIQDINECNSEFIYFELAYKNTNARNYVIIIDLSEFRLRFNNN